MIWVSAQNATICRGPSPCFAIPIVRGLPNWNFDAEKRFFLRQAARLFTVLAKLAKASKVWFVIPSPRKAPHIGFNSRVLFAVSLVTTLEFPGHPNPNCCVASTMCSCATNVITSHPTPTPTQNYAFGHGVANPAVSVNNRGSLYYRPKQGTIIGQISQNYLTFALFEPQKIGTPLKFNIAPEIWCLEDKPFLLGRSIFRGELSNFAGVSFMTPGQRLGKSLSATVRKLPKADWPLPLHRQSQQVRVDQEESNTHNLKMTHTWQFFVTFLGSLSDPFKWSLDVVGDLQLGDKKVTLNHLVIRGRQKLFRRPFDDWKPLRAWFKKHMSHLISFFEGLPPNQAH